MESGSCLAIASKTGNRGSVDAILIEDGKEDRVGKLSLDAAGEEQETENAERKDAGGVKRRMTPDDEMESRGKIGR